MAYATPDSLTPEQLAEAKLFQEVFDGDRKVDVMHFKCLKCRKAVLESKDDAYPYCVTCKQENENVKK